MQRFKNILMVLNPEVDRKAALDKAVVLCRQNQARLTLFSVVPEPSELSSYADLVLDIPMPNLLSDRQQWVQNILPDLKKQGVDAEIIVVEGIQFLEIIRQVLRAQHDLVITTAEDSRGIRARVFGTTSMHLMRKCPCPVWVVKHVQRRPYARILAAVDPSAYDPDRDALNPLILELASALARQEKAELHILHVWEMFGEQYVRNGGMNEQEIKEAKEYEKKQHRQRFETLLSRLDVSDLKPYVHLVEGHPDVRIPELTVEQDIDLLVMGTVCRTGIAGFFIGNVAEEVLNQVDCSILTLKPEGFVTPVHLE